MTTLSKPSLSLSDFKHPKENSIIPPWDKALFFQNGCHALIYGLDALNLKKQSKIAIPAYICSSVTKILINNDFVPVLIDISEDLLMPEKHLLKLANDNEIDAVLLIDYFGFLSEENINLAKNMKNLGLFVIIDRCHSAFAVNTQIEDCLLADMIIYSLRKSLSVSDGGALFVRSFGADISNNYQPWFYDLKLIIRSFSERFISYICLPNLYSKRISILRNFFSSSDNQESAYITKKIKYRPIRRLSFFLFNHLCSQVKLNNLMDKRLENYKKIENIVKLNGCMSVFGVKFNQSNSPQIYAMIDQNGGLLEYLRENGIGAYSWPGNELPIEISTRAKKFPNTISCNKKVVCLPVHQSLNKEYFSKMNILLYKWTKRYN